MGYRARRFAYAGGPVLPNLWKEDEAMIVIGIDPGITGAIAQLGHRGEYLRLADLPTMNRGQAKGHVKRQINGAALAEILADWTRDFDRNEVVVICEVPIAFPGLHASAIAASFQGAGVIEGVVVARYYVLHMVPPTDWKKALKEGPDKIKLGRDKEAARAAAIRLYPEASLAKKKDHNRAEALLIAKYGHQTYA